MSDFLTSYSHSGRALLEYWHTTAKGQVALQARIALLRTLVCGWPRRAKSVLVMTPGNMLFPEFLHEAGFDVTVQEEEMFLYNSICCAKRPFISGVLSSPEHMPFDDNSFDYTVVVTGVEFWEHPEAVLEEIGRVTCSGCILLFTNMFSFWGVEQLVAARFNKKALVPGRLCRPGTVKKWAVNAFAKRPSHVFSMLFLPSRLWSVSVFSRCLPWRAPLPFGAVGGMRINFGNVKTGTPLRLPVRKPVTATDI